MNEPRLGRVVVTGHTDERAAVVSDVIVAATELCGGGVCAHWLYGGDNVVTLPHDGTIPSGDNAFPPPGGFRFSYLTIPSGANGDYHSFIADALGTYADPDAPGFHQGPTLDLAIVVYGRLILEVGDGDRVDQLELVAGDAVVQCGTRHRWSNSGDVDAVLATVMLGTSEQQSTSS